MEHVVQVIPNGWDFYKALCLDCDYKSMPVSGKAAEAFATAHRNGESHSLFIEKANQVYSVTCMCGYFRERSGQRAAELIGSVHLAAMTLVGSETTPEVPETKAPEVIPDSITLDIRYKAASLAIDSFDIVTEPNFGLLVKSFEEYLRTGEIE